MNEKQYREFGIIAQQCDSGQYSSINVASQVRSDAILAAWQELKGLRQQIKDLLAACEMLMRPDGHYLECPCPENYNHIHMPHSRMVKICEQLQTAIAKTKGKK
jgi:hypothetical protein